MGLVLLLTLIAVAPADAQVLFGLLVGNAIDPSSAAVAGVAAALPNMIPVNWR